MALHERIAAAAALCSACLASPAAPRPDDPGTPDGGAAEPCGTLSALSDDFDDGLSNWMWTADGEVEDNPGALRLLPLPEGTASINSNAGFSVDGGELVVELDTATMEPSSVLRVALTGEDGEVALRLEGGTLHADVHQSGFDGTRDSVAFQANEMRTWRIARRDGQFEWATRGDNSSDWQEHGRFDADLAGVAHLTVDLTASAAGASDVTIAGINPGQASEPACPVADLRDEFILPSTRWSIREESICDVRFADAADIGIASADTCGLVTRERFSLVESEVAVELLDLADCSLAAIFQVTFERGQVAFTCSLEDDAPVLHAYFQLDGTDNEVAVAAWNPEESRFLRFKHSTDEGGVLYETSPDGLDWNRFTVATGLAAADLQSVEVALLVYAPAVTAQRISFDRLNIPPDSE